MECKISIHAPLLMPKALLSFTYGPADAVEVKELSRPFRPWASS